MDVLMVVLPSLLTGAVTLIVCLINNNAARQKQLDDFKQILAQQKADSDKTIAIMNLKIEELTKQVTAHNNLISRTYDLEKLSVQYAEILRNIEKRIDKLEDN
jgi:hypothetical protein